MQRVNEAYGILQDVSKRARYDAGLKLESAIGKSSLPRFTQSNVYRPPYRCGLVMVSAIEEVGRLNVKRILGWQDIVNNRGQILTTFWRYGDDQYSERWI
jgi:curved DNA-binding protein CbpA